MLVSSIPYELPVLEEEDYTFGGWFFDSDCVNQCKPGMKLTSNITLYAKFSEINLTFDEIFAHIGLSRIIKQEVYVQSRWFLADNSLDNAMKSFNNKLIGLQRLDGVLEHNEAELNNEISANMTTEEKEILRHIIFTSDINSLYSSVKRQIRIQMKLKEEHEEKIKKRNVFILSIFMAVFTACSLYSEVNDIITGEQQNIGLLISMLVIAVGAVIIDYWNK
jgi:uncharacterized repeat protein (TIGR02543 family)